MARHIKGSQRVLDVMDSGEGEKKRTQQLYTACVPVDECDVSFIGYIQVVC